MRDENGRLDEDRLAAAKLWLITTPRPDIAVGDMPYLAQALYALTPVGTDQVDTMTADDKWRIYINPAWLATTAIPELSIRLAHLVWHLLADHANRANDVQANDRRSWHTATDATIGELLDCAGVENHDLPTATSLGLRPGAAAEEHYARLSKLPTGPADLDECRSPCGSCCDGWACGYEAPIDVDVGYVDQMRAVELRAFVAIAYQGHRGSRGDQPGEWLRRVEQGRQPIVSWRSVLGASVRRATRWASGNIDYTYSRRSRRQQASPQVILPGMRRPAPAVAVVLDTSASMDDDLLAQALGEVKGVLAGTGVDEHGLPIVVCDAAVQAITRITGPADIPLAGGGGTDLRHGIDAAARIRPRPDVLIVLTDGDTPWPQSPPPGIAVIAALIGREQRLFAPTPAWAQRIECVLT